MEFVKVALLDRVGQHPSWRELERGWFQRTGAGKEPPSAQVGGLPSYEFLLPGLCLDKQEEGLRESQTESERKAN